MWLHERLLGIVDFVERMLMPFNETEYYERMGMRGEASEVRQKKDSKDFPIPPMPPSVGFSVDQLGDNLPYQQMIARMARQTTPVDKENR